MNTHRHACCFSFKRWGQAVAAALLFGALAPDAAVAQIQTEINREGANVSGAVIDDYVLYNIGGGRAVSMSRLSHMQSLAVGVGWNSNLVCGDMDLQTTIKNQLNGITDGFEQIMSGVIQNATGAVASLPALILQRSDPALYNLLTNGILQARLDYDRSRLTCQAMAEKMADVAGGQTGWGQLADGMALRNALTRDGDAVAAVKQAESSRGNDGVPWIGGCNAGGQSQQPIKVVSDVTRAGYNLLNSRSVASTDSVGAEQCSHNLVCQTWKSPEEAAQFAVRVLGEQVHQTCDGCTRTEATAGVGLTPLIQEAFEVKRQALQELVSGAKPTTVPNLQAASSNALPVTRGVIEALRNEPDLDLMVTRLASEVALASVLEKALLLQRLLLAGSKEPNVAANDLAQQSVATERGVLEQEISNLKTELELRQQLAHNTATAILERYRMRSESSRGIYEGDPERDRLSEIQKPAQQ
jgi:integrating conjugative element protein (TIGR03755 family)